MSDDPAGPPVEPLSGPRPRTGAASEPHVDYAHAHDAQADRTRWELWAIVAIVVVVIAGGLVWRAATGSRPAPREGWNRTGPTVAAPPTAAAATGVSSHGADAAPAPRPIAP